MSAKKVFLAESELVEKLNTKSVKEIADELGVGETTLRRYMKKCKVTAGHTTGPPRTFCIGKDELSELYQKHSCRTIADKFGVGETVVWKRIKEFGIELDGVPGGHRCKTGVVFSAEHRKNLSEALTGKNTGPDNYNWRGGPKETVCTTCDVVFEQRPGGTIGFCSEKCYHIYEKFSQKGSGNKNWTGGVSSPNRSTTQARYKAWRKAAIDRAKCFCEECGVDGNNVCVCCGRTPDLHVHHIKPWRDYPELRYALSNAQVLCASCHRAVHSAKTE